MLLAFMWYSPFLLHKLDTFRHKFRLALAACVVSSAELKWSSWFLDFTNDTAGQIQLQQTKLNMTKFDSGVPVNEASQ